MSKLTRMKLYVRPMRWTVEGFTCLDKHDMEKKDLGGELETSAHNGAKLLQRF
jgi:hypothetical protein